METMVIGAFERHEQASEAVNMLGSMGYRSDDLSVIFKGDLEEGGQEGEQSFGETVASAAKKMAPGAAKGAALGGVAGLVAAAVPLVAGIFIGGPVAIALGLTGTAALAASGAATGAVAGGVIGALTKLGVSEDTASEYNQVLERGGVILGADAGPASQDELQAVMEECGAVSVTTTSYKA
jgi:hypothetical protein